MVKSIRKKARDMFEPNVEGLVRTNHPYRKLLHIVDFKKLCKPLEALFCKDRGRKGYHIESGFASLVSQWMEDLSDRELERFLLRKIMQESFFAAFPYWKRPRITLISHT